MNSEIRAISANLLSVDPKIQRPLDEKRVEDLAAKWNDNAVGILTVSDRGGQSLIVIDGQTRLAAMRKVAGDETTLPLSAQTYTGLTEYEEAELFLRHNDRKAIKPMDRFRIALVAREQWAVEIQEILNNHGWRAMGTESDVPDTHSMNAIAAAEGIYNRSVKAFADTFETLTRAWGHENGAASVHAVHGIGHLFARHGDINKEQFVGKLRRMRPGKFIGDTDMIRHSDSSSVAQAAYRNAIRIYNSGRREESRIVAKWGRS